jgi:hypothetical protein
MSLQNRSSAARRLLAHVPAKWIPVRRQGHAPTDESRPHPGSAERGCGLVAGLLAGVVLSAAPASAEIKQLRDWIAACDNLRACSAFGFDAELSGNNYIRLERDGAAEAAPRITIVVEAQKDVKFRLAFDDPALAGLPSGPVAGETTGDDDDFKRLTIAEPQAVAAALASLRKAKTLVIARIDPAGAPPSDPAKSEISLSGLAAALLWIDDQQKRVGTVTALIGRGDKPAAAVPPVPTMPVVTAAKRATGPVPKKAPAAVVTKARAVCEDKKVGEPDDVVRLDANAVMYSFVCTSLSGAYNFFNALVVDAPGKQVRLAEFRFPREYGATDRDYSPINAGFDEATQTLSTFNKGRGLGDCGSTADWVWDGQAFRLILSKTMPECHGIGESDWPVLYRAERK